METGNSMSCTNYWSQHSTDDMVPITCLIPNHAIKFTIKSSSSIKQLKKCAYCELSKITLDVKEDIFNKYKIFYINQNAHLHEIEKDEITLFEVDFFLPIFRLMDINHETVSSTFQLHKFLLRFNFEVGNISSYGLDIEKQRQRLNEITFNEWNKLKDSSSDRHFVIKSPQYIKKVESLSKSHQSKLLMEQTMNINICVQKNFRRSFIIAVKCPVISSIRQLKRLANEILHKKDPYLNFSDYVFKLPSQLQYLLGEFNKETENFSEDTKLIDYQEIQDSIIDKKEINLMWVKKEATTHSGIHSVPITKFRSYGQHKSIDQISVWDLDDSNQFSICIKNIKIDESLTFYFIKIGLFYGEKLLEPVLITKVYNGESLEINDILTFSSSLNSLPVNTKICITILGCKNKMSNPPKSKHMASEAWINIPLYNEDGIANEQSKTLNMYTSPIMKECQSLYPLGTTSPPPCLKSDFKIIYNFIFGYKSIQYPLQEELDDMGGKELPKVIKEKMNSINDDKFYNQMSDLFIINELSASEQIKLWSECENAVRAYPTLLTKVMLSIPNFSKDSIIRIHKIIKSCPSLIPESLLELLHVKYCHPLFRSFLIKNLEKLSDETLELYMTQLVEGLKVENHMYNELSIFLLKRSMDNRRIAHYFLWNLLSDYENPETNVRNAILVEAYCNVRQDHFKDIAKQVNMLDKLKNFYNLLKVNEISNKEEILQLFKKYFSQPANSQHFTDLTSPIDPTYYLKRLVLNECIIMESKKKPVLLSFEAHDVFSNSQRILYKYGDDLRQDKLVLQSFKIISNLCQNLDAEIKFNCYGVMNVGKLEGMIQFVEDSTTLGKIQAQRGIKTKTLYEWYYDKLKEDYKLNEGELKKGAKRFSATCAGYSVMTYILGIGDRHNDNIMLHKSGRLFHIDFGHILGNFKNFYGIKRERVPFIMTKDFLYFACNANNTNDEIMRYRNYCAELFVLIREYSSIIITPFLLMVNSGLPELNSEADINYILWALDFSLNAKNSKDKFTQKFTEAWQNSWSTTLNFKAHNMKIASAISFKKEKPLIKNFSFDI